MSLFHYANAAGWAYTYRSDRGICGSLPRAYAAHYRRIADRGTGTRLYLNPHNWVYDHLSVYVFYRANWNTDLDVDALLDEYYTLFYGRGAVPMGKFWDEVEAQFTKTLSKVIQDPLGSRGVMQPDEVIWGEIYSEEVLARWKGYFAEAEALIREHDDPIYQQRLAYIRRNSLDMIVDGWERHRDLVAAAEKLKARGKGVPIELINAGFEKPFEGKDDPWVLWGKSKKGLAITQDTRVKAEGKASARLTGQARRAAISQAVQVKAGGVYRFSFQYRGQMVQGAMRVKLLVTDPMPGGARGWAIDEMLTYTREWGPHRILFQAPTPEGREKGDRITLKLSLQADQMMEGDRLWYDDVKLEYFGE